jgi:hypothetical protein
LDEKKAEYIRQVNVKEIDEVQFWELVGELDLERALGESVVEGLAAMQATMQNEEVGESKQDELAEEAPVIDSRQRRHQLLAVGKGKRKVAPTRAKVYAEVDSPVSNLLKSLSICVYIYSDSATDALCGRCSRSAL